MTPRADVYTVASGAGVYAGKSNPVPAWLAGVAVGQWVSIAGTSGAGGAAVDAYSGLCVTPSGDVIIAAAGGHTNSSDNRVVRLRLSNNAPAWLQLCAPTASPVADIARQTDGKPSSRHLYAAIDYVPGIDRVMLVGARYTYVSAISYPTVDGYSVAGGAWDAGATYSDAPTGGGYGQVCDGTTIWTNGLKRFNPATNTWSSPITSPPSQVARYPWAYDSSRQQIFGMCYGDGEGSGTPGLNASKIPVAGTSGTNITFNSSSAYTSWLADTPQYSSMDYDPINDRFLFIDGSPGVAGKVYAITPNSGSVWDMSLPTFTGSAPGVNGSAGAPGRLRYVSALKGFVYLPQASSNLFFLRIQ